MIRFVPDTNVLVSATIVRYGPSGQLLQAWFRGEVELVTSSILLSKLQDVLTRPRIQKHQWMTPTEVSELLLDLSQVASLVTVGQLAHVIAEDPDDDWVLSAALAAQVDYIVSGDHHLLDLGAYRRIAIVTPARFLEIMNE